MKKTKRVIKRKMWAIALGVLITSCSNDSDATEEASSSDLISVAELNYSDESEQISEELSEMAEEIYSIEELQQNAKGDYNSDYLPDCLVVSKVLEGDMITKTLDFGDGCELRNGNTVSGKVVLRYQKDMVANQKTITLSLEDYTFNAVVITGGATIVRTRSNANGNPQSVVNSAYEGTWPGGLTSSFEGNRTREWVEGYGSGTWQDNVFLVTGSTIYTNRLGVIWTKEVVTALRREMACRFIVSGVLAIYRNDATATLDFGGGECDNKGELTWPNGEVTEVNLRRFR
ncbi:hypothetical protein [Flavobacterium sp. ASW18X]|uniref:hypothetical protein n=1 Tax=Flavobacterium sp. ASW18X TaxID=2572595 RepID=UPI0010AE66F0|nr:hypothetical protein [Flavobacterium sp. ASW18X]TKD59191.1 hypothetical protein FBT53_13730 [Flavobacterium sp. ASW18X]